MKLNEDGTLTLHFSGTLTTAEVQALMDDLAELRAKMSPEVPQFTRGDTRLIPTESEPVVTMTPFRKDGTLRFGVRSSGFGWLYFNLSPMRVQWLRDEFTAELKAIGR